MKNLPARRRRWLKFRLVLLTLVLGAGVILVARRGYQLQVNSGDELRQLAEDQYLKEIHLAPKRGTIYDRNGAELAVSVDVDSAWANPRELRAAGMDPVDATARIASVLDVNVSRIETRLRSDRYFVWIKRRLSPRKAAELRALEIPGLHMRKEARRYYPNRELAAHILGFANIDGEGIEGIELDANESLTGSRETVSAIRDRRGRIVFSDQLLNDRGSQGNDVHLTIDRVIQRIAERELQLAVRTYEARAGSVVVMDPQTGELLAMANYPTFNPNDPGAYSAAARRNRAVTDFFEPGSTVKPFTVAGAFAARTIRAGQQINCENGALEVGEDVVHDSHAYDELTPSQILAHSSNIGTAKIGGTLGRKGLFRVLRRFGFGRPTGLPLPGESPGLLRHYRRWYAMDAVTISFGQGMSVTNIQLALAMASVANGGQLMRPRLIRRVHESDGSLVQESFPEVRRRVVSPEVARLVGDMLTAVTGPGGTGEDAAISGTLVAGKTGTAQKADYIHGGYARDKWLASFVGFVPADRPRLVISVVIDEPIVAHYGGTVAGPVFRRVGAAALRHLGVSFSGDRDALVQAGRDANRRMWENRKRRRLARRFRRERGIREVSPEHEAEPQEAPPGFATIPDLAGQGARNAVHALFGLGLVPRVSGTGVVVGTIPQPGVQAELGAVVRIELRAPHDPVPPDALVTQLSPMRGADGSPDAVSHGDGAAE